MENKKKDYIDIDQMQYDDIDAIVNATNQLQKENKAIENAKGYKGVNNSNGKLGNLQYQQLRRKLLEERKAKSKTNFKRIIAAILAAAVLPGAAYHGAKLGKKIIDNSKVNGIVDDLVKSAEDNLLENGLGAKENDKFKIGNNTVEDYGLLDADTELEVYAYKKAINNAEEFNKFIQSVTYDDGLYHYINYEQFLGINGFYDPDTQKMSSEVFENMVKATILSAYENSTVSSLEEEFYTTDLGNNKTR